MLLITLKSPRPRACALSKEKTPRTCSLSLSFSHSLSLSFNKCLAWYHATQTLKNCAALISALMPITNWQKVSKTFYDLAKHIGFMS